MDGRRAPNAVDNNGIETYSLYFVLSALDYWQETGDVASLVYFVPVIADKLEHAFSLYANPQGLRFVGHDDRLGNGFCNSTTPETQALYRFLSIRCWSEFADALSSTGVNATLSTHFRNYSTSAVAALRASNTTWWHSLGLHSACDAVNAGFTTEAEGAAIGAALLSDIVSIPSHSNFNQYFILQAQGRLGQLDRAVESIRIIWGSELALGATTFWEISHPDLASILTPGPPPVPNEAGWCSLAHPWSSGPTPWLTRWVLGVRPLEAGYGRVLVAPHIAHTMTGVSGSVGTVQGTIAVVLESMEEGGAAVVLTLPVGVRLATLRLSQVLLIRLGILGQSDAQNGLNNVAVTMDGPVQKRVSARIVNPSDAPLLNEGDALRGRSTALEMDLVGGRSYSLRIISEGDKYPSKSEVASPFPPPSWPGQFLGADYSTHGTWIGLYGADGYALFGFNTTGSSGVGLVSLPSYVESLTVWTPDNSGFNGRILSWVAPGGGGVANDTRPLQDPTGGTQRRLGALAPSGSGSALVDIVVKDGAPPYTLSAYFVDYGPTPWGDGQIGNRTQEVYVLTGYPQLNPATQRQVLTDFAGGVWLSYALKGGVRFRVSTIRGDYAVLSALSFDTRTT